MSTSLFDAVPQNTIGARRGLWRSIQGATSDVAVGSSLAIESLTRRHIWRKSTKIKSLYTTYAIMHTVNLVLSHLEDLPTSLLTCDSLRGRGLNRDSYAPPTFS